ncbi:MAG TPA: M15 family metallopeptidase [Promicromonospora sp.]|nr:M15 family metallopeptidase [Promicromonospora sp.]
MTDTHSSTQEHEPDELDDVTAGPRRGRRPGRAAWTGALALAVTGGVLAGASASAPVPQADGATPEPVATGRTATGDLDAVAVGAAHHDVTADQVGAVLDRAEAVLRRRPNPGIAQAAAELGMLWTTYQAQEQVLATAGPRRAVEQVTDGVTADRVTFDQVAVAAMRLANLLDPTSPSALVELRADAGTSLRGSLLRTVATHGDSTAGYANGRIPADVLCPLDFAPGHLLRCDAAERLTALSTAFEDRFGYPLPLTDSYRSLATQLTVRETKPHLAALPGTSNHGWGLAVDLGDPIAGGASAEYVWLRLHGPDYGWDNPSWARLGGDRPEPWHFEFFAAGSIPNRAVDPADVGTWADGAGPRTAAGPATADGPAGAAGPVSAVRGDASEGRSTGAAGGDTASSSPGGSSGGSGTAPADGADRPADEKPQAPAPSEPPAAQEPEAPSVGGVVGGVVEGTVGAVTETLTGTVGGVGGLVGGLLGAGGTAGAPRD